MVKKERIRLYTIGIGPKGEFDNALLEQLARDGNGKFFAATNAKELQEVYDEIDQMERSRIKSAHNVLEEHYFQWFLAPALFFLGWLMWRRRGVL
jgi:Ca-activated chloride channel family protein